MPIEVARTGDLEDAIEVVAPRPDALPVLPLRDLVAYPDTLTPLAIGQERSVRLINDIMCGERQLVLVAARDPEPEEPGPDGLHAIGVAGIVARMLRVPDGTIRVVVQATERVRITDWVAEEPYLVARIESLPDEIRKARSSRPSRATCSARSRRSSRRSRTCPRSFSWRSRTSTTPRRSRT